MYKYSVKPGIDDTSKIITVYQKRHFLYFDFWFSVERVLSFDKYVIVHLDHFESKYGLIAEGNHAQHATLQPAV